MEINDSLICVSNQKHDGQNCRVHPWPRLLRTINPVRASERKHVENNGPIQHRPYEAGPGRACAGTVN